MPLAPPIRRLSRRDPAVAAAARAWRELTAPRNGATNRGIDPSRRTLLACSGGADSSALILALSSAVARPADIFTVAHILHDLRPAAESGPDRDAAKALAESLGLPFVEYRVQIKPLRGNAEASARRLRYAALAELAAEHRCPFIATAHHADDQLESILMALLRGSGPAGLQGIAPVRQSGTRLPPGVLSSRIIRPLLSLSRQDAERLCRDARWEWREDATNRDTTRLRAALRHDIIPGLKRLRPNIARTAARTAALMRDVDQLVGRQVRSIRGRPAGHSASTFSWPRTLLRAQPPVILGALLRSTARSLSPDHLDRLTSRPITAATRAIRSPSGEPKHFAWRGLTLCIDSVSVTLQKAPPDA